MKKVNWNNISEKLTTFIFYLSIILFFTAFNFQDSRTSGWYQQFMPNLNGKQISDITFLDSLTGYAVVTQSSDSSYILKTTNGGDNWSIIYRQLYAMTKVKFLNSNTGFVGGGYLYKTINGGFNWVQVNPPPISVEDMFVLSQDTIWVCWSESLAGGLFRTANGGINWQLQYSQLSANPSHIYMYNGRLGFMDGGGLKRTTDGGNSWTIVTGEGQFTDMHFVDSLIGWKCYGGVKKTTDGGLNWTAQILPSGGNIIVTGLSKFSCVNKDTIWGVGGTVFFVGGQYRGMIYRTTNGGTNWYYQLPDTSIHIPVYYHIGFANKFNGWAYSLSNGVHTTIGGDSSFIMSSPQISTTIPNKYKLYQNYPNPFNSESKIRYKIEKTSLVKIIVFDIQGKEISILINKKLSSGSYEVNFNAGSLSSGIYFYSLLINGERIDTKKMILIK